MSLLKELRTSETSGSSIKISSLRDFGTTPPIRAPSLTSREAFPKSKSITCKSTTRARRPSLAAVDRVDRETALHVPELPDATLRDQKPAARQIYLSENPFPAIQYLRNAASNRWASLSRASARERDRPPTSTRACFR